jgi:hypothetical protein
MANWANIFPILLILVCLIAIILFADWRRTVVALAVMYIGSFILFLQVMPITLASVKLISGWTSALLLGLLLPAQAHKPETGVRSKLLFYLLALVFIWILAYLIAKPVSSIMQSIPEIIFAGLAIFGTGLFLLGIRFEPHSVILGILLVFSGFELLYASVETSVLINGLLSAINLLMALIGSLMIDITNRVGTE